MKRMTRFVSVMLACSLVVASVAGCGKKEEGKSEGSGSDAFKIGGIGPTTGGAAIYGQAVKNAMELAVEEINADGGINGAKVEMNFQDDEHDAEKSVNAYNTLKDWGMQALLGTVTSTPSIAVANETQADNMFQLTPSGSAVDCVQYENAFRVCFSDPNQGIASAQYIGENGLAKKVAVIYDSSDVYSSGIYEKFTSEAKNQGIEVVAAEAFTADNNKDFSTQLQKAKDAGAELVFLPIYYTEAALILGQADKMGFDTKFFGCDGLDGILTVENFEASLADGVMLLTPFAADAEDEATKNFVESYKEKYGDIPNQFAADAYDGMYAIKAAFEAEKITPDMSISDICEAAKKGMTSITVKGLTGGEDGITWTADGEPNKSPKAVQIKDGAYTAM
ncbi:ABC transporter substrate-binding protein [Lachnospiraceae bacterium LCP25S3_G4]